MVALPPTSRSRTPTAPPPAVARAVRESGKKPEQLVIISFKADTIAEAVQNVLQVNGAAIDKGAETGGKNGNGDQPVLR